MELKDMYTEYGQIQIQQKIFASRTVELEGMISTELNKQGQERMAEMQKQQETEKGSLKGKKSK